MQVQFSAKVNPVLQLRNDTEADHPGPRLASSQAEANGFQEPIDPTPEGSGSPQAPKGATCPVAAFPHPPHSQLDFPEASDEGTSEEIHLQMGKDSHSGNQWHT